MGCIVGFYDESAKKTYMAGAPNAQIWSFESNGRKWLIGMDADPRYLQLCRYGLELPGNQQVGFIQPSNDTDDPLLAYVVTVFTKSLMECLEQAYVLMKEKDGGAGMKGAVLLSTAGRFFEVTSRFVVETQDEPFAGIGENSNRALGSLFTSLHLNKDISTTERLKLALKAAKVHGFNSAELDNA